MKCIKMLLATIVVPWLLFILYGIDREYLVI
jgi:hypothetical protein